MRRTPQSNAGFTLIELLVVIIIIGILAAIATPMFLGQRDKARESAVKSGVYSIRVGVYTVMIGNDSVYPEPSEVASTGSVGKVVSPWPRNPWKKASDKNGGMQARPWDASPASNPKGNYAYLLNGYPRATDSFSLKGFGAKGTPIITVGKN